LLGETLSALGCSDAFSLPAAPLRRQLRDPEDDHHSDEGEERGCAQETELVGLGPLKRRQPSQRHDEESRRMNSRR
jgi:hypothetical protein